MLPTAAGIHRTEQIVRVLITGIGGFVGRHLAQHLLATTPQVELHGTVLTEPSASLDATISQHALDLRDSAAVAALFQAVQPEQVYHVAAMAAVGRSFHAAWETIENNTRAQLNVIEGCLSLRPRPRLLIVSSGEIYGPAAPEHLPTDENAPLRPSSPYSVSKVAQDMLGLQYFLSHQLAAIRVRPFNHLGPGQSEGFVAPDFAMQIARVEQGVQEPRIFVGNLTPRRDFTDARDVVRAYALLMRHGQPGEVYNVASGQTHTIRELLDALLGLTDARIEVCEDPQRLRPAVIPILWGDAGRLRDLTGWQPGIPFEQTLMDVLDDCRQRVLHAP